MFLNEKLHDDVIFLMMEQQSLQFCHVYLDGYIFSGDKIFCRL